MKNKLQLMTSQCTLYLLIKLFKSSRQIIGWDLYFLEKLQTYQSLKFHRFQDIYSKFVHQSYISVTYTYSQKKREEKIIRLFFFFFLFL